MRTRRRRISIVVALLIVTTLSWPASAEEPLFAADEILELTIHGPLTSLARGAPGPTPVTGRLELRSGATIPMTFSTYGISRLRECGMPCLKIMVEEEHARGTVFEGHPSLWLVTPCHHGSTYDGYILLEYLIYESYAVIAEPALQVRLVSCRFRDDERPTFPPPSLYSTRCGPSSRSSSSRTGSRTRKLENAR